MLTCRDVSHQADASLDGELSFWKRLRIRLHLSMCNGCTWFVGQMCSTRNLLGADVAVAWQDARIDGIPAVGHTKNQCDG